MSYFPIQLAKTSPSNPSIKTVPTGTAETIASSTVATRYVRVCADANNTVAVYVGGADVSVANSIPLFANNIATYEIENANLLYCISGSSGQKIRIEVL